MQQLIISVAMLFTSLGSDPCLPASALLLVTTNKPCALHINGGPAISLKAEDNHRQEVVPGEVLVRCIASGRYDERVIVVDEGRQSVVQFFWTK